MFVGSVTNTGSANSVALCCVCLLLASSHCSSYLAILPLKHRPPEHVSGAENGAEQDENQVECGAWSGRGRKRWSGRGAGTERGAG